MITRFLPGRANNRQVHESCSKRIATGQEIICMAIEDTIRGNFARLVVGTRDRAIGVFQIDLKGELIVVFCVQMEATVPIGLAFVDNTARDILVFGLYDGRL